MKNMLDYYAVSYNNILVLGDMNMLPSYSDLIELINSHDLYNMIKSPTCFKSSVGRCIDLLLTNKKYSFLNTRTFETGFSDFHVMIYTMLKTTYQKVPQKIIKYRNLKNISHARFESDLKYSLSKCCIGDYDMFENTFRNVLDVHAPFKTRIARGNDKPYIDKGLRKQISIRSRLRNKANKSGDISDLERYKKQRNYVANLNSKSKISYLKSLDLKQIDTNRTFWKVFKRKDHPD